MSNKNIDIINHRDKRGNELMGEKEEIKVGIFMQLLAFYSKKLTKYYQRYTITDLELLSIVITLKEFRSILLGQEIIVYTDYKNLESKVTHLPLQLSLYWHLLILEYSITLKYIKGKKNTVTAALSCFNFA